MLPEIVLLSDNFYPIWDDCGWLTAIRTDLVELFAVAVVVRPGLLPEQRELSSYAQQVLFCYWLELAGGFEYGHN